MALTVSNGTLATLSVQQGPLTGQQFSITQPSVTIGRTVGNDIVINDSEVSRHHVRITWNGQQFIIEDLGSTNGTFVNGVRITTPQPLVPGASLRLGTLDLRFQSSLAAAVSEPVTHVSMPVPQQPVPAPVYSPPYAVPVKAGSSTPWLLILGGGGILLLALIAVALGAILFLGSADSSPTATITSPRNGSEVALAQEVPVIAVASDQRGVTRVEFWVDGGLQDAIESTNAQGEPSFPVQFQWTPDEAGSHLLEIHAYNRDGQSGESATVVVKAAAGETAAVGPGATSTGGVVLVVPTPTGQGSLAQGTPFVPAEPTTEGCTSAAAFVADVTIPDYTRVEPGQRIDKIWRISNNGTCPWDAGYQLAYSGGELMNAPLAQAVPPTSPGGTADVQVSMYGPAAAGTYKGIWRLRDGNGLSFGPSLTVIVVVSAAGGPLPDAVPAPAEPGPGDVSGSSGCSPAIDFRADRAVINRGEGTTLRWDVECVREVYFQGEPVIGHESRDVTPDATTTYTLRVVRNDGGSEERQVTIQVQASGAADSGGEDGAVAPESDDSGVAGIDVTITYHSYDAATGQVIFRILNGRLSPTLECIDARIVNFSSGESYSSGYSNAPFASSTSPVPFTSRLEPEQGAYLKYVLRGTPSNVRVRATFEVYTGENRTGSHVTKIVDFTPPGSSGASSAATTPDVTVSFHSYDAATGQVIFRILNGRLSPTLECIDARIVNFSSGESYSSGYSNAPFASSTSPVPFTSRLEPEQGAYLKYVLRGTPSNVRVRATFEVYAGENRSGGHVTQTVDFTAAGSSSSGGANINAVITFHSYDRSSRWVTLRVVNTGDLTLESAGATFNAPGGPGVLYGPGSSNSPFRDSPTSDALVSSVAPGATKYMRYRLREAPAGTAVAATIELYSENDLGGQSLPRTLGFVLP